jgi:AraC family transcriptional regulator
MRRRRANPVVHGGVTAGVASVTPLLSTPTLSVGEFHCPPGDASWGETNRIGDRAHVVFPRRSVLIRQLGREPVLATPNHAMLYNADQRYRRELHHQLGDESVFVELTEETLEQLAGDGRLHATHVPAGRRTYLLQHLLVRQLRGRSCDELDAEELASRLVLSALAPQVVRRHPARERTSADHRELAEAAKSEIASDLSVRRSLGELAGALHISPFHLARVFRAETGFTLAGYRQTLRLRAALERLPENDRDLSALALELGFSSHSHFTASFAREFGVPPSGVKDPRRIRALLDAA